MTPDQLAAATLSVQVAQTWITGLAIFLGPLAGVLFTFWFQTRQERRRAKQQLFLILMSERKGIVTKEVAKSLNQIDIVFADSTEVKDKWHAYYGQLLLPPSEARGHAWLEMLGSIGRNLGYKDLSQVQLDKFYQPQGHVDDAEFRKKIATQWSRVLENTEALVVTTRTGLAAPPTTPPTTPPVGADPTRN